MIPANVAEQVRTRAGRRCEYCQFSESQSILRFHTEHIVSRKHGGSDDFENLAFACPHCNWNKGSDLAGLDPDTGKLTQFFNPRVNAWKDHFDMKAGRVIAKSAQGRTTLWVFRMNDDERVRCRSLAFGDQ